MARASIRFHPKVLVASKGFRPHYALMRPPNIVYFGDIRTCASARLSNYVMRPLRFHVTLALFCAFSRKALRCAQASNLPLRFRFSTIFTLLRASRLSGGGGRRFRGEFRLPHTGNGAAFGLSRFEECRKGARGAGAAFCYTNCVNFVRQTKMSPAANGPTCGGEGSPPPQLRAAG